MNREGLLRGIGIGFLVGLFSSTIIRFIIILFSGEDVPFPTIFVWGPIFFAIFFSAIAGARAKEKEIEKIPISKEGAKKFWKKAVGFGLMKQNKDLFKWAGIGVGIALIFYFLLLISPTSVEVKKEVFVPRETQEELNKKAITPAQKSIGEWEKEMYKKITWRIKDADKNLQEAMKAIRNGHYDLALGFAKVADTLLKDAKKYSKKISTPPDLKESQDLFNLAIDRKIQGVEMLKKGLSEYKLSIHKINQGLSLIKESDTDLKKAIDEINSIIKTHDLPTFWWKEEKF